jgi:NAD(P)-dependent dehydrogenase (short-subunit alcohol dehydrogenase family)
LRRCFRKNKKGIVIGVLSQAMGKGIGSAASSMGGYTIGKYGMLGMLAALAADYPWLKVKSISPGYTTTPMLNAFDDRFLELQRSKQSFSDPADIAALILSEVN